MAVRSQAKRRRRNRRLAVAVSVLLVAVLLGVVAYEAVSSGQGPKLDSKVNQPVSSSNMAGLAAASMQPYGPAPPPAMRSALRQATGTPWNTGKPVVLYVGGEFCMYCALQRWALVLALSRFGSFSGLHYMTSGPNEGDLPTFTFVASTYASSYVTFRPFELEDRSNPPKQLQSLPSNYTAIWGEYGGGFPFIDLGNTYVVSGSLLADTSILQGKNWTSIIGNIAASDSGGIQVREAANLLTAAICKLTQGAPPGVCGATPIDATAAGIAAPAEGGQLGLGSPAIPSAPARDRVIQRGPKGA